jgi:hypothetical protein
MAVDTSIAISVPENPVAIAKLALFEDKDLDLRKLGALCRLSLGLGLEPIAFAVLILLKE